MAVPNQHVAEMQGLYGPFTVHERVLQKIWRQRDFSLRGATLADGRRLEVLSVGAWNTLAGPDFKRAMLRVDGRELEGDVEVHFHARDWTAHAHAADPAYRDVVLHVVLFPPDPGARPVCGPDGREIATLVLLPLLHRDLEEYAADDALEAITARDDWWRLKELAQRPRMEVAAELRERAASRWRRKVEFARVRLASLGWEEALHHSALEILGYRHNRIPMLMVAERWGLAQWREAAPLPEALERVHGWQRQGLRPANHPAVRLGQYREWVRRVPDWPAEMAEWGGAVRLATAPAGTPTIDVRRSWGLAALRESWATRLTGGAVGGTRFDTVVCDGVLPFLAAREARPEFEALWFHWFPGDLPGQIRRGLAQLGITGTREQPLCHGFAQGLLAWLIERELRA